MSEIFIEMHKKSITSRNFGSAVGYIHVKAVSFFDLEIKYMAGYQEEKEEEKQWLEFLLSYRTLRSHRLLGFTSVDNDWP